MSAGYRGLLEVDGGPGVFCDAADLGVPSPVVENDVYGVYHFAPADEIGDVPLSLGVGDLSSFWQDPYGPVIRVWTTAGSGTIVLDKPVQATFEPLGFDLELLKAVAETWAACHPAWHGVPIPGWFDIRWLVDPPPPYQVLVEGTGWQTATVTLQSGGITQSGTPVYDDALGTITLHDAVFSGTWTVDAGREGSFEFRAEARLAVDLVGLRDGDGYMVSPAQPTSLTVAVPRESLPRGVTAMSFDVPLTTGEVAFVGVPGR